MKNLTVSLLKDKKIRYVLAGAWNTLFGYCLMVSLYENFNKDLHLVFIAFLSSFIAITMSFLTYKIFVFKTKGNWFQEWMRSFLVYGGASLVSTTILWLLIDIFLIDIYIAQAISIVIVIIVSYISHSKFTFKK